MPRDLLRAARERAEHTGSPVKAVALLHIARVLTAFDPQEARKVLGQGLDEAAVLPFNDRNVLFLEGLRIAAAVDPDRAMSMFDSGLIQIHGPDPLNMVIRVMIDHGHVEKAAEFLSGRIQPDHYPFGVTGNVMQHLDDAGRLRILRAAIQAWRERTPLGDARDKMTVHSFLRLFSSCWQLLPREEATEVIKEISAAVLDAPDVPCHANIMGIRITSQRAVDSFTLLGPLQALMPGFLTSLVEGEEQLARLVEQFPQGTESIRNQPPPPREPSQGPGFIVAGRPEEMQAQRVMMLAENEGNFEPHFEHALDLFLKDTGSERNNYAPLECWPSTQAFRHAMYRAAISRGREAGVYLDRIPDPELRLLAEIEFIAALVGLPETTGVRMSRGARSSG